MDSKALLYEYLPNNRDGGCFIYSGSLSSVLPTGGDKYKSRSVFLVPYRGFDMKKRHMAIFGLDQSMYLDVGNGPSKIIDCSGPVTGALFWHTVSVKTTDGVWIAKVFTHPLRYLENDGMFSEEVEPITHLIPAMANPPERERWLAVLLKGANPAESNAGSGSRDRSSNKGFNRTPESSGPAKPDWLSGRAV
jgi:hypothetical protein